MAQQQQGQGQQQQPAPVPYVPRAGTIFAGTSGNPGGPAPVRDANWWQGLSGMTVGGRQVTRAYAQKVARALGQSKAAGEAQNRAYEAKGMQRVDLGGGRYKYVYPTPAPAPFAAPAPAPASPLPQPHVQPAVLPDGQVVRSNTIPAKPTTLDKAQPFVQAQSALQGALSKSQPNGPVAVDQVKQRQNQTTQFRSQRSGYQGNRRYHPFSG